LTTDALRELAYPYHRLLLSPVTDTFVSFITTALLQYPVLLETLLFLPLLTSRKYKPLGKLKRAFLFADSRRKVRYRSLRCQIGSTVHNTDDSKIEKAFAATPEQIIGHSTNTQPTARDWKASTIARNQTNTSALPRDHCLIIFALGGRELQRAVPASTLVEAPATQSIRGLWDAIAHSSKVRRTYQSAPKTARRFDSPWILHLS